MGDYKAQYTRSDNAVTPKLEQLMPCYEHGRMAISICSGISIIHYMSFMLIP